MRVGDADKLELVFRQELQNGFRAVLATNRPKYEEFCRQLGRMPIEKGYYWQALVDLGVVTNMSDHVRPPSSPSSGLSE